MQARSSGISSAEKSLQYVASINSLHPEADPDTLARFHDMIESCYRKDDEVRTAMNAIGAWMEKNPGIRPFDALSTSLREVEAARTDSRGRVRGSFSSGVQAFTRRHEISGSELQETLLKMEPRHTTLLGKFGTAGGILIGAAAGAVVGAGVGAAVGALVPAIKG